MTEAEVRHDTLRARTDIACLNDLRALFVVTGFQIDGFNDKTVLLGIGESVLPARVKSGSKDFEVLCGSDVGSLEPSQMLIGSIFTIRAVIMMEIFGFKDYYAILETEHKELYAYWLCCR